MTITFEDYRTRVQSNCVQEASIIVDEDSVDLDWQSVEEVVQPTIVSIQKHGKEIIFIELATEHRDADVLPGLCKDLITKYEAKELEKFAASYNGVITIK